MRPQSIIQFERLYILEIVIGLIVGVLTFSAISSKIVPPGAPATVQAMLPFMTIFSAGLGLLINVLLLYFIARRGSDVAKWIFVIFFVLGAAGAIRGLTQTSSLLPLDVRLAGLVQLLIQIAMMVLLFRPDSKAWFARR